MEIIERPDTLVSLTSNAAEKIRELMAEDPEGESSVLRVAIQGGGCSGFQYGLGFDAGPVDDDQTLEQHGVTIVIDPYSAPYLKGATIDFLNGLEESGFKIDNPNASASCGCGHSFTVEEGADAAPADPSTAAAAAPAARTSSLGHLIPDDRGDRAGGRQHSRERPRSSPGIRVSARARPSWPRTMAAGPSTYGSPVQ